MREVNEISISYKCDRKLPRDSFYQCTIGTKRHIVIIMGYYGTKHLTSFVSQLAKQE